MDKIKAEVIILSALFSLFLTACFGGGAVTGIEQSGEGAVGPQEIVNATEVIKFDPALIPLGDVAPIPGACVESSLVPGTYRCDLEAGGPAEPCFAIGGTRLICDPDPVAGTYRALIGPTNALPSITSPRPDSAVPFFVELADGMTCVFRTSPEPVIIGGISARYDCDEPYTYLLGEESGVFDKDAPLWMAGVYVLDPTTGESPSGKIPKDIVRVWIP